MCELIKKHQQKGTVADRPIPARKRATTNLQGPKKAQARPRRPPEEAGVCQETSRLVRVESSAAMSRGFSCTGTMVDPMLDAGLERHTGMIVCSQL